MIIGPAHPLRGGLASFNERLALEFQNNGHNVTIYTFSLQYPGFLFPGTTQFSSEPPPANISIKIAINSINPFNWISVGNTLKKLRPDLIVVRYWLPFMGPALGTILRIAKSNKHTKVVCLADNVIPHEKRLGDVTFTKYFMKAPDAFITMSEKVLEDLKTFAATKPARYVAHPLYDNFGDKISKKDARKLLGIEDDKRILLFFGFIRKYKGLDILLDAINVLKSRPAFYSTIKLLIAGEFYEDAKPYEEQIKRLNIEDALILKTNFIPDSEVKNYLCAADVVIQPYRSATQSGVTPLAYHFEIPMIVTNVGGLPALVPDGKVGLVSDPEAIALAEIIESFFQKGAESFLPGLIEEKKKYSWKILIDAMIDLSNA